MRPGLNSTCVNVSTAWGLSAVVNAANPITQEVILYTDNTQSVTTYLRKK